MPRNLTVKTFLRIEFQIAMSNVFFLIEIIIFEILLTLRESLLALSQLSTFTSSLFTVAWTLLISPSDAKTVVSLAKWIKCNWFKDLYTCHWSIKGTFPNTEPSGTPNVPNELRFLIKTLFIITQIKQTSYARLRYTIYRYTVMVICLLSNDE